MSNHAKFQDLNLIAALTLLNYLGQKKPHQRVISNKILVANSLKIQQQLSQTNCISKITYLILRSAMRNPSSSCLTTLYELHKCFSDFIPKNNLDTLNWILGGLKNKLNNSNKYGFVARVNWKKAEDLQDFLKSDPRLFPPSKLIVGLECISCALSYRSINADWVEPPFPPMYPETSTNRIRKKFYDFLKNITQPWQVESVGTLFNRTVESAKPELVASGKIPRDKIFDADYHDTLSEVSDDEDGNQDCLKKLKVLVHKKPAVVEKRLPNFTFYRTIPQNGRDANTWPYSAHAAGLNVRANVSGTAPLALSVIMGIAHSNIPHFDRYLRPLKWNPNYFGEFRKTMQKFASLLLIPNYERSDYHTVAETYAGITYYCYKLYREKVGPYYSMDQVRLHPISAYLYAIADLSSMVSSRKHSIVIDNRTKLNLSLKEAINIVLEHFLKPKIEKNWIPFQVATP